MIDLGYIRKLILEDGEEYLGFAFGYTRDEQNSWKEQPTNKANGNRKSLGHLKGAKTIAR
jgi:hypothetical protein